VKRKDNNITEILANEKDKDNRHRQFEFLILEIKEDRQTTSIITTAKLQLKSCF
jgi:hypothetical protein